MNLEKRLDAAIDAALGSRIVGCVVLVNQGEPAEAIASFLASQNLKPREVLLDLGNQLGQATGAYGMPTTFFYAADGRLRHSHMGELSAASLEHGLQQLAEPRR